MRLFISLVIVLTNLSCSKEEECDVIRNKEEIRGNYYFYFNVNFYANPQSNSIGGVGLNSDYVSGKVSKEVYDRYAVGDEYCF